MDFRVRWCLVTVELLVFLNLAVVGQARLTTSKTCQIITAPMCKHVNWNTTSMPNYFEHENQEGAELEMQQFVPLVKINCSVHLRNFLCSLYTPPCTGTGRLIPVCKSLCETARHGCRELMKNYGFTWPFDCDSSSYIVPDEQECIGQTSQVLATLTPVSITTLENNMASPNVMRTVPKDPKGARLVTPKQENSGKYIPNPLPPQKCRTTERMTMSLCENLPWNISSYPNFLGHQDQLEAGQKLNQFFPLVKIQCSKYLRPFLCAIYNPPCLDSLDGVVLPVCRSLCLAAKEGCDRVMQEWGFKWPEALSCTGKLVACN